MLKRIRNLKLLEKSEKKSSMIEGFLNVEGTKLYIYPWNLSSKAVLIFQAFVKIFFEMRAKFSRF